MAEIRRARKELQAAGGSLHPAVLQHLDQAAWMARCGHAGYAGEALEHARDLLLSASGAA